MTMPAKWKLSDLQSQVFIEIPSKGSTLEFFKERFNFNVSPSALLAGCQQASLLKGLMSMTSYLYVHFISCLSVTFLLWRYGKVI
jgi:hypothetical protein